MRTVSEHLEFEKLTKVNEKLYVRALLDYNQYLLYDENAEKLASYTETWAALLLLQETYQQSITDIYTASGAFPLSGQMIHGFNNPCIISNISYAVFLDAVVINFECKEDMPLSGAQ